ncbi:hypothetical protein PJH53_29625, partial [Mycobacterium kansasii]
GAVGETFGDGEVVGAGRADADPRVDDVAWIGVGCESLWPSTTSVITSTAATTAMVPPTHQCQRRRGGRYRVGAMASCRPGL